MKMFLTLIVSLLFFSGSDEKTGALSISSYTYVAPQSVDADPAVHQITDGTTTITAYVVNGTKVTFQVSNAPAAFLNATQYTITGKYADGTSYSGLIGATDIIQT